MGTRTDPGVRDPPRKPRGGCGNSSGEPSRGSGARFCPWHVAGDGMQGSVAATPLRLLLLQQLRVHGNSCGRKEGGSRRGRGHTDVPDKGGGRGERLLVVTTSPQGPELSSSGCPTCRAELGTAVLSPKWGRGPLFLTLSPNNLVFLPPCWQGERLEVGW